MVVVVQFTWDRQSGKEHMQGNGHQTVPKVLVHSECLKVASVCTYI